MSFILKGRLVDANNSNQHGDEPLGSAVTLDDG
jgi:hypothetical protein